MKKLEFKKVSVKNFMSYGNIPTELNFDNDEAFEMVIASNGSGKTALFFDTIYFALYGSPLRSVKKAQITNFINGKECLVTLDVNIDGSLVTINRGLNPGVFTIEIDGKEKFQNLKDTEKQRELNLLVGINRNILSQMVLIGAENESFMKRTPAARREFIEFILDLGIFSRMNDYAKTWLKSIKSKTSDVEFQIQSKRSTIDRLQEIIDRADKPDQDKIEKYKAFIDKNSVSLATGEKKLNSANELMIESFDELNSHNKDITTIKNYISFTEKVLSEMQSCDQCGKKPTSFDTKSEELDDHKKSLKELQSKNQELSDNYEKNKIVHDEIVEKLESLKSKLRQCELGIESENAKKSESIEDIEKQITDLETEISETQIANIENEEVLEYLEEIQNNLAKGIAKNQIVAEYLPYINNQVNYYLQRMGLPLLINFDEKFNDSFQALYRNEATYDNFSTGEKALIDFAILLTWKDLASKLSSVETNIMIIDEFGNDLDDDNVQYIIDLISEIDTKFIAISPKLIGKNPPNSIHSIEKHGNFSVYKPSKIV